MRYPTYLKCIFCLLFSLPFFTACRSNAYLPPPNTQNTTFFDPVEDMLEFEFSEQETPPTPVPTPPAQNEFWDVSDVDISMIDRSRKLISFTFDDAPSHSLERILAVFASYNESNADCPAQATLFCNGYLFDNAAHHAVQTACALGWELGNHTHSHLDLNTLSPQKLQEEIDETEKILFRADGKREHLLRAPFGNADKHVQNAVNVPIVNWTIDTLDWTGASADEIYNVVFEQKFSGAIVLMHDGYPNTVAALKRLLPDLKAAGYQVTSVSAMAKAHDCQLKRGSVYIRARKK